MSDVEWEAMQWAVKEGGRCGVEIGFFRAARLVAVRSTMGQALAVDALPRRQRDRDRWRKAH